MNIIPTELPGVVIIEPKVFSDPRGFFLESYQIDRYQDSDVPLHFVQDNMSRSSRGVLRGLHYQRQNTQGKLVFVTRGAVLDVAVDVRYGSPTFGKSVSVELSDQNHRQLYVPPGFAHGFYVLSDVADFFYKVTDYYSPTSEVGILWNDPDLNIPWPDQSPLLSPRDLAYPRLKDISVDQLLVYQK